ncbi:hypothetical protein KKE45_01135 [Patescibacteria group bacterium]|nr:hypothetical protein [Patescibacteria group bacterium]
MKNKKELSLNLIAFLQATALLIYCSLVGLLFLYGNNLFGKTPNFLGPLLFLILFVASALVSALITLGYPVILFWKKKQTVKAIKLVINTTIWLIAYILIILFLVLFLKNL